MFHFQYKPQVSPIFTICQVQTWGYFYMEKFPWWKQPAHPQADFGMSELGSNSQ